jgi:diacylglycerol kinase (ATP)
MSSRHATELCDKQPEWAKRRGLMLKQQWERVRLRAVWSWAGWVHVWRTEASLTQWIVLNIASALLAFILPLSAAERGMILMGGIFVLAMECVNTAIERVVDDISTDKRDRAMQAKDAGSAAVAVSGIAVGVAWVCVIAGLIW